MDKIREKKREKKMKKRAEMGEEEEDVGFEAKGKGEREEKKGNITLFVRNIGFETTEAKFKEFMEKFGEVNYAVLCKQNLHASSTGDSGDSQPVGHKGTGFVQFKQSDAAI